MMGFWAFIIVLSAWVFGGAIYGDAMAEKEGYEASSDDCFSEE